MLLDKDDLMFTMRALATGVLLCITKPVPVEIAEYLWQLVAGEKIRKTKKVEQFRQLTTPRRLHNGVREEDLGKGCSGGNTSLDESHKLKKKMKFSKNANQEDNSIVFKRKLWIDWTPELHERFVYAIRKLGEGSTYFLINFRFYYFLMIFIFFSTQTRHTPMLLLNGHLKKTLS